MQGPSSGVLGAAALLGLSLVATAARAQPSEAALAGAGADRETVARDREQGEDPGFDTGGELGYAYLDELNYLAPTLSADARVDFFQGALRVPLRLDTASGDLRKKDWDETSDFFRIGQCLRMDWSSDGAFEREHGLCLPWDVHRDDYYISARMGPVYDLDLAHGTILRAYSNNLDPDHFQSGVVANMQFHQFVVGEMLLDNVTRPELIGGTVALQPFAYEVDETPEIYEYRHHFHVAATAVSDLGAPTEVRTAFGRALTDDAGNLLYRRDPVTVVGADLQYRFVFGQQIELEARADWNYITDHGMGTHVQVWGIYNHPDWLYTVRGIGEFRYIQENYIPNYFDSYYFIQRQQYGLSAGAQEQLDAILTGPDSTFATKGEYLAALPNEGWNAGYLGGISFEMYRGEGEARRTALRARLYISDVFGRDSDGQFLVTLELPRLMDKIDVYALYSRQNFGELLDIFELNHTLVKLQVRWDLNEQFYVQMNYGRIWQIGVDAVTGTTDGFSSNNEFGISLGFAEELAAAVAGGET